MYTDRRPWMHEPDPEKALEKIFEVIAEKWVIYDSTDPMGKRVIEFRMNPYFNPQKVYPNEITGEGYVVSDDADTITDISSIALERDKT